MFLATLTLTTNHYSFRHFIKQIFLYPIKIIHTIHIPVIEFYQIVFSTKPLF